MKQYAPILLAYWAAISFAGVIVTCRDKSAAVHHRRRTPERVLMLMGLFGGAEAMLLTMCIIRHKTRHPKFMLGLPLEILLHIAGICCFIFFSGKP